MAQARNNRAIHIALWVAQGLFAILFTMAGSMKAIQAVDALVESIAWGRAKKAPFQAK